MVQSSVKPHKSGVLTFKNSGADEYSAEFYHNEILVDKYVLKARKNAERKITGASGLEDCIDPVDSVFIYKRQNTGSFRQWIGIRSLLRSFR